MYELFPQTKVSNKGTNTILQFNGVNVRAIGMSEARRLCDSSSRCVGFNVTTNALSELAPTTPPTPTPTTPPTTTNVGDGGSGDGGGIEPTDPTAVEPYGQTFTFYSSINSTEFVDTQSTLYIKRSNPNYYLLLGVLLVTFLAFVWWCKRSTF